MRIVFMGSGRLGCPAVESLLAAEAHRLVAVVTQPDRPRGRRLEPGACPVKALAESRGVPVLAPEQIAAPEAVDALRALRPDLIAVAAYGQFVPRPVRELPPAGIVNIHPSLLPRYRGAAPVVWAIANGDRETGVSIIDVTAKMDAGDILLQERCAIGDEDTAGTLEPRLAAVGARLLLEAIGLIARGAAARRPQDEALATHARKLEKADGRIEWRLPAAALSDRIRAFQPWPGSFCLAGSGALKVLRARAEPGGQGVPGQVLDGGVDGPLVATGHGALRLLEVQPEGRRPMSGADYVRGVRGRPGMVFT